MRCWKYQKWMGVVLAAVLQWTSGCAGPLGESRDSRADRIAAAAGLTPVDLGPDPLPVRAYGRRGSADSTTLRVYIESDGAAFIRGVGVAADPTPTDPISLRLAAADPASNLLYLGRPCQYREGLAAAGCADRRLWTIARYGEAAVAAIDRALSAAALRLARVSRTGASAQPFDRIELVGYSGGGAIAVLLAARRTDVKALVTVAGALDPDTATRLRDETPLSQSLNPRDVAVRIADIPQLHFVGAEDEIVPIAASEAFVQAVPAARRPRLARLDGFDHACCWVTAWPRLLGQTPLGP